MAITTQKFAVSSLRGIDQRWETAPNSAYSIENMTWTDQDSWRTSRGWGRVTHDYVSGETTTNYYDTADEPLSLHWFSQNGNARQFLVYEDKNGELHFFNGSASPSSPFTQMVFVNGGVIGVSNSAPARVCKDKDISYSHFSTFGRNLYILNENDLPLVFDGRKTSLCGYQQKPGAPKVDICSKMQVRDRVREVSFGVGYKNSNNQYKYVVTFVNERGQESEFSDPSEKVTWATIDDGDIEFVYDSSATPPEITLDGGSYRQMVVINIPKGPVGTVARRIYRTQNMISFSAEGTDSAGSGTTNYTEQFQDAQYGSEFYFVDEIQDNICTTFVDTLSDLDLGSLTLKEDLGSFPINVSMMAVYKNTAFVADENTSIVRYSRPLNPEVFPPLNYFDLSDTQSSQITGLYATKNVLLIFKRRATYILRGNPSQGFFVETLSTDVGCICKESIRDVPGVGIMFLAIDGIYAIGTSTDSGSPLGFVKISQPIRKIFRRINLEYSYNFRSAIYHRDREYWLAVAMDDAAFPNHVLKFSYEIGAWSLYKNVDAAGFAESQDHRGYLFFAGRNTDENAGAKGLLVYGLQNEKQGIGSYYSHYETSNISLSGIYNNFNPLRVMPRTIGYGHTLTAEINVNREVAVTATTGSATQTRVLEDQDFPLFGSAVYDGDWLYKEHRPIISVIDFSVMHKGPVNEMRIKFTNNTEFEIIGFDLEATVGDRRRVIALSEKIGGGYGI